MSNPFSSMLVRVCQRNIAPWLLVGGVSVGLLGSLAACQKQSATALAPVATTSAPASASAPTVALPNFASLVEQYGPAVVNIGVVQTIRTSGPANGGPNFGGLENDPFFDFFRRFGDLGGLFGGQRRAPQVEESRSIGSGFVIAVDGVILTNAHVVADAREVSVKLTDRREFKAKVLGVDKRTDVAVLKIEAKDLPTVKLGNPTQAKVGEWVLAIGSPFGFENTVTAGIISAKARALPDENYVPFIQTDVAVNPGNSGGPLFNLNGEVIGINSQIYSRSGGFMGISFAIPIDVATKVAAQLQKDGVVRRGRVGAQVQDVTQDMADAFGLAKPAGALVVKVDKNSPAEKAGIRAGDVVQKVDEQAITRSTDLPAYIANQQPGQSVVFEIIRNRKLEKISIVLGELDEKRSTAETSAPPEKKASGKLGLALRPLTVAEARSVSLSGGLLVEEASGAAARAGVQRNDVIVAVNDQPVSSVEQLRGVLDEANKGANKVVALLVLRGDSQLFIPVPLKSD